MAPLRIPTHVDRTSRLVLVPGSITKNGEPQTIPLEGELWDLIERRRERREVRRKKVPVLLSPFVFHRGDGRRLGDFRKAWAKTCSAASVPGLLFHDLRRSAARNLIRAKVDRDVARKITGHKTESMFGRYNITDTSDQVGLPARRALPRRATRAAGKRRVDWAPRMTSPAEHSRDIHESTKGPAGNPLTP